jgi:hypothetical protein
MQKMVIKRVGVLSWAKIQAVIMLVFGLIIGVIYGLILMTFGAMMSSLGSSTRGTGEAAGGAFIIGLMAMIFMPIVYGIIGFIAGAIGAFVYNSAAKFVGGMELEMEAVATQYGSQPPYGQQPPYGSQQPPQWGAPHSY